MAEYTVTSDNTSFGPIGAIVNTEQLGTCNIPALIEGGHLAPVAAAAPAQDAPLEPVPEPDPPAAVLAENTPPDVPPADVPNEAAAPAATPEVQ